MNNTRRAAAPRPHIPAYFLGRPSWKYLDRYAERGRTRREQAT